MRLDWRRVCALLALELLGLLLYAPSVRYSPIWDDHTFVEGRPFLQDPKNAAVLLSPSSFVRVLPVRNSARPVWAATVALDNLVGHGRFWTHRLVSILWHTWAAAAVVVLCVSLGGDGLAALAAGALFLCHPVHVEAVEIVTFRADLLALFFMALGLAVYARARSRPPGERRWPLAGCLALLAAALLSKEMAVTAPLLALALEATHPVESWRGARRWAVAGLAVALVFAYLGFRGPRSGYGLGGDGDSLTRLMGSHPELFQPFSEQPVPSAPVGVGPGRVARAVAPWLELYHSSVLVRARTAAQLFVDEARLLLWPARLQGIYDPRPALSWLDPRVLAGLALAGAHAAAAWALRRRAPLAAFGLGWILISLLPVSGLVELPNLLAERYLVVPSAGLALTAGAALSAAWRRRSWRAPATAAFGAALLLGCWRVVTRLPDFRSDAAFHGATVRVDPQSPRAHAALARSLALEGDGSDSRAEYAAAAALWPELARPAGDPAVARRGRR